MAQASRLEPSESGVSEPCWHLANARSGTLGGVVTSSCVSMGSGSVLVTDVEEYPVFESFDDYALDENLLRGIYSYGFEKPSAIQQRAIQPILDGRDMIGQAQSGTGKTATFVIGCLQRVDFCRKVCQALILAPTRELANQIQKVALALGDYQEVKCHACIGGSAVRGDIDKLREGQH